MKPLLDILKLSLVAALFCPLLSQAETTIRSSLSCVTERELSPVLEKYQEIAILEFASHRVLSGNMVAIHAVLYMNPGEKTWTLIEKWGDDMYCVIGVGTGAGPVQLGEKL